MYPLPPESKVVSQRADVGLSGNGNHCDFWAEQIIVTKLAAKDIEAYYQDVKLPSISWENDINSIYVELDGFDLSKGALLYKISIFEFGKSTNLDFRCH